MAEVKMDSAGKAGCGCAAMFIAFPLAAFLSMFLLSVVFPDPPTSSEGAMPVDSYEAKLEAAQNLRKEGDKLARSIVYFRDERTGLCYAYLREGGQKGATGFTEVPYLTVKSFLMNPPE